MKHKPKFLRSALLASCACVAAISAQASSHREAPGITQTPKVDATDFYMFRSYEPGRDGYVTFIANYGPLQHPYGGPNYFTLDNDAIYEIHIDNDGDAIEDITFQFDFASTLAAGGRHIELDIGGETVAIPLRMAGPITAADASNLGEVETYSLTKIDGDRRSGTASAMTRVATRRSQSRWTISARKRCPITRLMPISSSTRCRSRDAQAMAGSLLAKGPRPSLSTLGRSLTW